jgi:hypothetical protein
MAHDVLENLSSQQVAAWYGRLADFVSNQFKSKLGGQEPLSAQVLRHWLKNKGANFKFVAPIYLITNRYVVSEIQYHRRVYLTEEKARIGKATMIGPIKVAQETRWVGIIPRLQGQPGFQKWDGKTPLQLEYTSNVEIPVSAQQSGSAADLDLLYAFHGFDLKTEVTVEATAAAEPPRIRISFQRWTARMSDYYDWKAIKHITVPNPDYNSTSPSAVAPSKRMVTVYHKHAVRLQDERLATPFRVESQPWPVSDPQVLSPAEVDPNKQL